MTRQEVISYMENATLLNELVTKEEASYLLKDRLALIGQDTYKALISKTTGSVRIEDFYFKRDVKGNIVLVYCNPSYSEIDLGDVVDLIDDYAFDSNDKLRTIKGDTVIKIGVRSFSSCPHLVSVDFANVDEIGEGCFYRGSALQMAHMSPMIIDSAAFSACHALREFDFSGVYMIGAWAFSETKITNIKAPNLIYIGVNAFHGCPLQNKPVPVNNYKYYKYGMNKRITYQTLR